KRTTKRNNKFKKNNLRRRRNLINRQPVTNSSSLQTFGPGSTVCRVTNYVQFVPTDNTMTHGTIDIIKLMAQSTEFESYVTRFRFFKIVGVKIIIQPRLTYELSPLLPARLTIDWASELNENILADDGAKQVMYYNTRPKVYRFRSPKIIVTRSGTAYNLGGWMHTGINLNNLPGFLKISSEFPLNLTCETIVVFRGNQTDVNPQSQIIKFEGGKIVEENKEEEEIKEEEKEKEEDVEDKEAELIDIVEEMKKKDKAEKMRKVMIKKKNN
ncbi:hypothetical protein KII05_10750, partial [Weissella confusa]|uniref:hypothetical protein n=1 Tax=Weissella confusa TaxID=1583 RepID=UPI001BCAE3A4